MKLNIRVTDVMFIVLGSIMSLSFFLGFLSCMLYVDNNTVGFSGFSAIIWLLYLAVTSVILAAVFSDKFVRMFIRDKKVRK